MEGSKNSQNKIYYNEHKLEDNLRTRNYTKKIRLEVLLHYSNGDLKCVCCGERKLEFLTIDHIEGKGTQHKKSISKTGIGYYHWLRKNNYPINMQILCMNCNFSRGHYGYCPHQNMLPQGNIEKTATYLEITSKL